MKKLLLAFGMTLMMGTAALAGSITGVPGDTTYPGSTPYNAPLQSIDKDNNIGNANESGLNVTDDTGASVGDVIKSDNMKNTPGGAAGTQRTHGEYQNNTNSCASCHQTHTAAAKSLLFKSGVYATCTACHDGTLGFYNVFANGAMASSAGTFGGQPTGNASVHLADGTMKINAAPGGNKAATAGSWIAEFNCAQCHAPHGSYSDRLLHYNPNNVALDTAANGGYKMDGLAAFDKATLPVASSTSATNILVKSTAGSETIANEVSTTPVVVAYKKINTGTSTLPVWSYVRDTNPWLYGYSRTSSGNVYYTQFKDTLGAVVSLEKVYGLAYAKEVTVGDVAKVTTGDIAPVLVVKLSNTTYPMIPVDTDPVTVGVQDFGGVKITKVDSRVYDEAGMGVPIGKYCAACHTDYRVSSGAANGVWSKAFRHTANNDSYTCLKCHFAHGTDVEVMADAKDNTVASLVAGGALVADAKAYLLDKNPSSALKRYTNMAVCWKCHTSSKASQLKNNDYYWNNTATVPNGPNNW